MSLPEPGKERALAVLQTRLKTALQEQKSVEEALKTAKDSDKAAITLKKEEATKLIIKIQKQIADLEGKNAPERVNDFGTNVGTLFLNAKPMISPYPEPKTPIENEKGLNEGFINRLLKEKFPCDREISREGIKVAEEILGNVEAVNDLNPELICKIAEEPDICKTDRGVILDSRCAAHQVVLSQSLSSLHLSVRNDIKKANDEYKTKRGLPIGPVMPTALRKRSRPEPTPMPKPTTPTTSKPTTSKPKPMPTPTTSIVKYDTQPDNWNGTGDPNLLTFSLDFSQNKLYSEYTDGTKFYRIYGDKPELIINLFLKHFAASHGMQGHLVFQIDMKNSKLYAANPNDKSILIYGNSPEEIVAKFNGLSNMPPKSPTLTPEEAEEAARAAARAADIRALKEAQAQAEAARAAARALKEAQAAKRVPLTKDQVYEQVFDSYSRFLCEVVKAEQKIPIKDTNMKKFFDIFVDNIRKYEKLDDVTKDIVSELLINGMPQIQKIINYYADESLFGTISESDKNNIKLLKQRMLLILNKNNTIDNNIIREKIKNICDN